MDTKSKPFYQSAAKPIMLIGVFLVIMSVVVPFVWKCAHAPRYYSAVVQCDSVKQTVVNPILVIGDSTYHFAKSSQQGVCLITSVVKPEDQLNQNLFWCGTIFIVLPLLLFVLYRIPFIKKLLVGKDGGTDGNNDKGNKNQNTSDTAKEQQEAQKLALLRAHEERMALIKSAAPHLTSENLSVLQNLLKYQEDTTK